MPLTEYQKKRDFRRTPEPKGGASAPASQPSFVVQRHAARRLHYDLRLEVDGVLKSWAVPKGPSVDPAVKSLAIEVEDHPLDYGEFEGVIPKGEYGGGTVLLFDRGWWEPHGDVSRALRDGKLNFRLHGQRLQGDWVLVRSTRRKAGGGHQWLLIKRDDDHAGDDPDHQFVRRFDRSVTTDRTMEEIAAAKAGQPESEAVEAAGSGERRPPSNPADLPGARPRRFPDRVEPQLARSVDHPPDGDQWLHEIKLDGYRLIAMKSGADVRLIVRSGAVWTERFPAIAEAIGRLAPRQLVLDGEVTVMAPDGTTDFQALQNSIRQGSFHRHVYFIFDALYCDGIDLTPCPLDARKQFLADLLAAHPAQEETLRYSDHVRGQGLRMFQQACRYAVEGVVSKRADARYMAGRSRTWLKSKCDRRQEFVIVGFTPPQGSRRHFGALLLAYYDRRGLVYCGKVGTGFSSQSLAELGDRLRRRQVEHSPLDESPAGADLSGVTWVQPVLVAEVAFAEWTDEGLLRQASFQGLREDKKPHEVRREEAEDVDSAVQPPPRPRSRAAAPTADDRGVRVAGVHLTHPAKILYPEQNVTKRDLADYYQSVADWMLPHLIGRPLALVRCPQGRQNKCFFQKHVSESVPEPIRGIAVPGNGDPEIFIGVDSIASLIMLVQLGTLEIHPWGSREDRIDRPDRLVIDLDPGPDVEWSAVVESAHLVRHLFEKVELSSFVRTTGGNGLHVVVPLVRRNDWSEVKQFAQTLARGLARRWPEQFIATATRSKRTGKIYVDPLRNQKGATAIASYSTRARPGATVATPLRWDELTPQIRSEHYHIASVPKRLASLKRGSLGRAGGRETMAHRKPPPQPAPVSE
jgi:bifunctional non-homologous end joining protein LigD